MAACKWRLYSASVARVPERALRYGLEIHDFQLAINLNRLDLSSKYIEKHPIIYGFIGSLIFAFLVALLP
jgi:hypothetical protein